MDQDLELGNVIKRLRAELQEAAKEGENEAIRFKLESIELELKVVAKKEGGPKGGFKFSVLGVGAELGGGVQWSNEQVQTVKLKMAPVGPAVLDKTGVPKNVLISDTTDQRRT